MSSVLLYQGSYSVLKHGTSGGGCDGGAGHRKLLGPRTPAILDPPPPSVNSAGFPTKWRRRSRAHVAAFPLPVLVSSFAARPRRAGSGRSQWSRAARGPRPIAARCPRVATNQTRSLAAVKEETRLLLATTNPDSRFQGSGQWPLSSPLRPGEGQWGDAENFHWGLHGLPTCPGGFSPMRDGGLALPLRNTN